MPGKKSPGPSVKDDKVYESVRKEGGSKEKAARIANASANSSRSSVGKKGGKSGSYDDWTVDELRKRAKELGLSGYSGKKKSDLVAHAPQPLSSGLPAAGDDRVPGPLQHVDDEVAVVVLHHMPPAERFEAGNDLLLDLLATDVGVVRMVPPVHRDQLAAVGRDRVQHLQRGQRACSVR